MPLRELGQELHGAELQLLQTQEGNNTSRRDAVLVHQDSIEELITGGVPLGGEMCREIIEAIFRKVSPVHDGATVIEKPHRQSRSGFFR